MGVDFAGRTNRKILTNMGRSRAEIFSLLTEAICHYFEVPMMLSPIQSDTIFVEEESFCHLVERVMNFPDFALYSWAQIAVGIYETIKGETYEWIWPQRNTPHNPFAPYQQVAFVPKLVSGEAIGRTDVI